MVLRLFLIDVALALLALLMILGWGVSLEVGGALYLMTVVITNVILLRHDRSRAAQPEEALQSGAKTSLYICSAIFLLGFVYGLLMILSGELPRTTLPVVLFPLLLGIYLFRMAKRPRKSTDTENGKARL
jgi:Ca2+/Na+ antiporter